MKQRNKRWRFGIVFCAVILSAVFLPGCGTEELEPFTNVQGTESTVCAHEGCTKKIARSGDTAYCEEHSARCKSCGIYIDEGLEYCTDCFFKIVETQPSETTSVGQVYQFQTPAEKN